MTDTNMSQKKKKIENVKCHFFYKKLNFQVSRYRKFIAYI